jgi:ABC-type polysaccharide/polyol phosphate export permease
MTPFQQRAHGVIWSILGPVLLAGLVTLVVLRPAPGTAQEPAEISGR